MRSKANIKTHPVHPVLIPFPIAFFVGTLLFDAGALIWKKPEFWQTATYLQIAGIGFALLAAVPGIIDFLYTVPPRSSARKRAALHGILNISTVVLFTIAAFYRSPEGYNPYLIIGLEFIGVGFMFVAGWMGGTLVHRNQIGVDHRYAYAGKWKEEYFDEWVETTAVATTDELKVNQMKLIHVNGKRLVVGRTEKGYVVFDDWCTHRGGSLAGGALICGIVQCPWHGSHFDVVTGEVKAGPAKEKMKTYAITEREGKIYLQHPF